MKKLIIFLAIVLTGNYFFLKNKQSSNNNKNQSIVKTIKETFDSVTGNKDNTSKDKPKSDKDIKLAESEKSLYEMAMTSFAILVQENLKLKNNITEIENSHQEYKNSITNAHRNKNIKIVNFKEDIKCILGPAFRSCNIINDRYLVKNGYPDARGSEGSRNEIANFLKDEILSLQSQMDSDLIFIKKKNEEIIKRKEGIKVFNKSYMAWKSDIATYKEDKRAIVDLHVEWVEAAMEIGQDNKLAQTLIRKTCSLEPGLYGCDSKRSLTDDQIWQFVELN
jgi:hypothetical protein